MKLARIAGITALALAATVPFAINMPGFANLKDQVGNAIAQNVQTKPQLNLNLTAEKQIFEKNGKKVNWQALQSGTVVNPGDVLRYNLVGENKGSGAAKNLVLTQPIPKGTVYVLKSATANGAKLSFSIDGGKTFSPNPVVAVKLANGKVETRPAPAAMYSMTRWDFNQPVNAKSSVKVSYKVVVK
ncbi:DUF11 domain-containing protein [Merismopedia glauca]|uniref:DUF11 domain-containing protein n=1 Tax=Merismopedia glauca CCAP 1448/3 TaxID=1296344 RepID=A0A2T1C5G0_9CYAN|nr:DUF11 domain-containing protein [Merismopedia glauca]PSB03486.1 hypothetical protein C7B64_08345 [Merismopedia glauca CCAP 1448/3]